MDDGRSGLLGELASDAAIERHSYIVDAADQLHRFLQANASRLRDLGGMVLIDDDPDYLSIAPDGTFRSRSRYQDEATGEWTSETEVIESPAELVELWNPADIYAAFADAAREQAGLGSSPTAADDLLDVAGIGPDETVDLDDDPYASAADEWAAGRGDLEAPATPAEAAQRLYDLALTFQERSQQSEARLVEQFEHAAVDLTGLLGDQMILDDEDERLWLRASGAFEAEVVPHADDQDEDAPTGWQRLGSPDEMVQFYDPTDLFGDLAEALAETFPDVGSLDDPGDDDDDATDDESDEEEDSRRVDPTP